MKECQSLRESIKEKDKRIQDLDVQTNVLKQLSQSSQKTYQAEILVLDDTISELTQKQATFSFADLPAEKIDQGVQTDPEREYVV